ncbi:MAG: DUF692 family multinuclear iron-containing protein [Solirubrobacteraceae bacterium]
MTLLERLVEVVDYLEVTPDSIALDTGNHLRLRPEVLDELEAVAGSVRIVAHGVGLSIGTASGHNEDYLRLIDDLLDAVPLHWHSEHLGYTTVDGEALGTMLSVPRTEESLDLICERVIAIQERFDIPFLLENIARYLPEPDGDYTEAEFLNALCKRTGCGLVLDVYNLECDAHNQGFEIEPFLGALDWPSVHELHVAGGTEVDGMKLDVHSQRAQLSTIALAKRAALDAPAIWGATYEFLPEAIPILGHAGIVDELTRLEAALA